MEKEIKFGFRIGFADWQIYALYISGMAIGIFFWGGNPVVYGLVGFFGGCLYVRLVASYFEWSLAKLKQQQRRKSKGV